MVSPKNKRPIIMILGKKTRFRIASLVGVIVMLGVLGILGMKFMTSSEPKAYFSSHVDIPVYAPLDGQGIQFDVQLVNQSESGENYFVNYRLKREQFRQETKAMLSELLNSRVENSQTQAQEEWLALSTKIHRESEIENLLKIKGFQDVVVDVFDDSALVIIHAQELMANEVSLIQDIVVRVTSVGIDKITVMTKK